MQKPEIERHGKILVVRDDLFPGGTKARVLATVLASHDAQEFIYPSVAQGYGGLALAYAGKVLGKKVTIVMPRRDEANFTPVMKEILAQGADIEFVKFPNFFHQFVIPHAQHLAEERPHAEYIPAGFSGLAGMEEALADVARSLEIQPGQVWCVGGSGTLARALQLAWPQAEICVVDVVNNHKADFGHATLYHSPQKFAKPAPAAKQPPFNSVANYDAKAWEFVQEHAQEGALFWNVAGDVGISKVAAKRR